MKTYLHPPLFLNNDIHSKHFLTFHLYSHLECRWTNHAIDINANIDREISFSVMSSTDLKSSVCINAYKCSATQY